MSGEYTCELCGQTEPQQVDLYTRKSRRLKDDDHRKEQSTDSQREQGHRWAHRHGYAVRRVWRDIASAYKDVARTDFDRALHALAEGEVPALWAYAVDRFSRRGAEDLLKVVGKARVVFDMDGLDSNESRDRRWIINRAEEAREYSETLGRRVSDTKQEQRDRGLWVAGRPPWGLAVTRDRRLYPDDTPAAPGMPSRADVVRDIYRRVAQEGASVRELSRWLDQSGIPGPGGKGWQYPYVARMLKHPAYVGHQMVQVGYRPMPYRNNRGELVALQGVNDVPVALVTEAEQRAAVAALAGLAERHRAHFGGPERKRDTRPRHLLTGLATCSGCGHSTPFQGRSYACSAVLSGRTCSAKASARGDRVEEYVAGQWLHRLSATEPGDALFQVVSERWVSMVKPEETAQEQAARAVLRAAEADLKRLLDDRQAGVYDGAAARYFGPMLRDATEAVDAARERVRASAVTADVPLFVDDDDALRDAWERADLSLRRDLLRLAIDRIVINKAPRQGARFDGPSRVTIEWADAGA